MAKSLGEMIREQVKKSPLTNKEITDKLNRSANTIYHLYSRESIDTKMLQELCEILNYDFFGHFYEEGPLKNLRYQDQQLLKEEVAALRSELARKDNILNDFKMSQELKEDNIQRLQEQVALLKQEKRPRTT